jgi:hypothetical protein
MEQDAAIGRGPGPADHPDLADLLQRGGPFVSCYLDTQAGTPDAPHRIEIRWKDLRRRLEEAGADGTTLDAVEETLSAGRRLGEAAAIVAAGGSVLLVDGDDEPLDQDLAHCGALPSLGQVLAWRQHRVPFVALACDRAGADIVAASADVEVETTAGATDRHGPELHKVHAAGWAHRRYRQRVENAWDRHAREVLEVVDGLVERISPRIVLYGGDPKACALIEEHAAATLRPLLQQAPLSRSADGSERHSEEAVRRALETTVATDTARLLAQLAELEAKSLGVEGAELVLSSLTAAQVGVLLVHDDPSDERTAFFSREPFVVSSDRISVEDLGGDVEEARLVDVAIYGAFCTGAGIRMAPGTPLQEGIGALLRFAG